MKWPDEYTTGVQHKPLSRAYFCPKCGEIWARIVCDMEFWTVMYVACQKHTPFRTFINPGGIFYFDDIAGELPTAVLIHDFLFLMSLFDKESERFMSE